MIEHADGFNRRWQSEVSARCELVSAERNDLQVHVNSGHKGLPLGKGSRAARFEGLSIDEVAFGVEMVMQGGMDGGEFLQ